MDKHTIEELRRLPVESVAERLGINVVRHKALCPFHSDHHASLSFNIRKNTFRCFACGANGGVIDLAMQHLRKPFPDACRWLADEHNIIAATPQPATQAEPAAAFDASRYEGFFRYPRLSQPARDFLFSQRQLDSRVVSWCRLTSWRDREGHDWLQIPYYDTQHRLIGVQNRFLRPTLHAPGEAIDCCTPRFRFPRGSKCTIYNLPVIPLLQPGEMLYITEGPSDCWALLSAGKKAIAIPSATLLKGEDVSLLVSLTQRLKTPMKMFPDRDVPGERLFMQLQHLLPTLQRGNMPPECKDFAEYYLTQKNNNAHAQV